MRVSGARQGHTALAHVFSGAVGVGHFAFLVRFEKEELGHALVGVDARRQRRGVGKLQRHVAFPFGLQRGYVDDDAAAGVGGFAQADGEHVARNAEIFDRARQGKGIGRDDADVAGVVDKAFFVKGLGIDNGGVDVGEDLEFVGAAPVVAVARRAVGHHALAAGIAAHLTGLERFDHAVFLGPGSNPAIGLEDRKSVVY